MKYYKRIPKLKMILKYKKININKNLNKKNLLMNYELSSFEIEKY